VAVTDAHGAPVSSADSARAVRTAGAGAAAAAPPAPAAAGTGAGPGSGVWTSYDFVPGDRVIFYDDFSGDAVNDPPHHETTTDGDAVVGVRDGARVLSTVGGAAFDINLPAALPQRFTIEMTYWLGPNSGGAAITADFDDAGQLRCGNDYVEYSQDAAGAGRHLDEEGAGLHTCRMMVSGPMVKLYMDSLALGAGNGFGFGQTHKLHVGVPGGGTGTPSVITEIRIAEGALPLYETLAASGRVATHGILFATGSDVLEAASTPTLAAIGAMMAAHPELRLTIEGHTDNAGDAAANQALSERRAQAVRAYLVSHGVDAARLTAVGAGATRPAASNDTPEGRQQNRRVELVRG
jgi:outer membrane protein OmpA-like peptidoglycan-associated protein